MISNSQFAIRNSELSPKVQPIYEHIAGADFYQLERCEKMLRGEIISTPLGIDEPERRLLLKAIALRKSQIANHQS